MPASVKCCCTHDRQPSASSGSRSRHPRQRGELCGEHLGVLALEKEACHRSLQDLGDPPDRGREHRPAGRERLDDRPPERFVPPGGHDDHVGGVERNDDVSTTRQEGHPGTGQRLELGAVGVRVLSHGGRADDEQPRDLGGEVEETPGGQREVDALLAVEPADVPDDEHVVG